MLLPGAAAGMEGFPVNWEYELLAAQLDKGGALRALIHTGPALAVAAGIYLGAALESTDGLWSCAGKPLPRKTARGNLVTTS